MRLPSGPRSGVGVTAPTPASRRAAVFALLVVLAAAVLVTRPVHDWLLERLAEAEQLIRDRDAWSMAAFVALAGISAMAAFVSSAILVPVAVYVWGPVVCALLLWCGWLLGGLAAYAVGRGLGRPIVLRLVRPDVLERYEGWARNRRSLIAIVLLQLAIPSDLAGYVFGVVQTPFVRFALALAVAEIPYALGAVLLGVSFLEAQLVPLLAVGLGGVALAVVVIRRYLDRPSREPRLA